MIAAIRQFFERNILEDTLEESTAEHGLKLATAALLIEMSRADFHAKPEDKEAVSTAVGRVFDLNPQETQELVALAEQEANQATSLYSSLPSSTARSRPSKRPMWWSCSGRWPTRTAGCTSTRSTWFAR